MQSLSMPDPSAGSTFLLNYGNVPIKVAMRHKKEKEEKASKCEDK